MLYEGNQNYESEFVSFCKLEELYSNLLSVFRELCLVVSLLYFAIIYGWITS